MKLTLEVWRQPTATAAGQFETYQVIDAKPEMTILELLDRLNDTLLAQGAEPVAFESDCREGICGTCGITVNVRARTGPCPTPRPANNTCVASKTVQRCAWNLSAPPPTRSSNTQMLFSSASTSVG